MKEGKIIALFVIAIFICGVFMYLSPKGALAPNDTATSNIPSQSSDVQKSASASTTVKVMPPKGTGSDAGGTQASAGKCYVGGCSSEVCSDQPNAVSSCIYTAKFACYKTNSVCERQATGKCGWTETPGLAKCIAEAH